MSRTKWGSGWWSVAWAGSGDQEQSPSRSQAERDAQQGSSVSLERYDFDATESAASLPSSFSSAQERLNTHLQELSSRISRENTKDGDSSANEDSPHFEILTTRAAERATKQAEELVEELLRQALPMLRDSLRKEFQEEHRQLREQIMQMSPANENTEKVNEHQASGKGARATTPVARKVVEGDSSAQGKRDSKHFARKAVEESTSPYRQRDREDTKEHANKLEPFLEFRSQVQQLELKLQHQELQSIEVSRDLDIFKQDVNNQLSEMKQSLEFRGQAHELQQKLQQQERGSTEVFRNLDIFKQEVNNKFSEMQDVMSERSSHSDLAIRSELEAMKEATSSDLQRHDRATKELEKQIGELSDFRVQSQRLHEKLQSQQEAQSSEVCQKLEEAKEAFQEQLIEMQSLVSERNQALSSAVQGKVDALKEATSSDLQRYSEAAKEYSDKLKQLWDFRVQSQEMHAKLQSQHDKCSADASRDLEALRETFKEQLLEVKRHVSEHTEELRVAIHIELDSMRAATSSDLKAYGATAREHSNKLDELFKFRSQSQELHTKLQSQQEVRSTETSCNLEAFREICNGQLLETRKVVHELITADLQGDRQAIQEHANQIERLLELGGQVQEWQRRLKEQELRSTEVSRSWDAFQQDMNSQLSEIKTSLSERSAESALAVRTELEIMKEATSSDLQGHEEANEENVSRTEEFLDLRRHMQDLQQQLSTRVARNDFEAMREYIDEQVLKVTASMQELRTQLSQKASEELHAVMGSTSSGVQGDGQAVKEFGKRLEELLEFRSQSQAWHEKLRSQHEAQSAEASRNLEALSSAVQSQVDALREATSSDLQMQREAAKEYASKLGQLCDFRDQSQKMHDKLKSEHAEYSTEVSRDLEALRETLQKSFEHLENLTSERHEQLSFAIRNQLEAMKEATSSDLRGHAKATKEHADKIEELSDMRRHMQDLQQSLSTYVPRNDFEAMQKHVDEQSLKATVLIQELQTKISEDTRKELQALREANSSNLHSHAETTKEHANKLEQLLEFRGQSQDLYQKLQLQQDEQSKGISSALRSVRDNIDDAVCLMSERNQELSLALHSELEATKAATSSDLQACGESAKDHADKLEQLLEFKGHSQELHERLQSQQELHSNDTSRNLEKLRENLNQKLLELTTCVTERNDQLSVALRSELEAMKEATRSDLREHGETAKEQANKLEQLLLYQGQSQEMHQKLQTQQESQSTEVSRNLELLKETSSELQGHGKATKELEKKLEEFFEFRAQSQELYEKLQLHHAAQSAEVTRNLEAATEASQEQFCEMRSLISERDTTLSSGIQHELQAFKDSTSSVMRGHGEAAKEHADKLEQLFEFRSKSEQLHEKLQRQHEDYSTEASCSLEALRGTFNEQLLKLQSHVSERTEELSTVTRRELGSIRETTYSDLKGHGEAVKKHASKIDELLEFRSQSQEFNEKLQSQQEVQSTQASGNLEALRESFEGQLLELKSVLSERSQELSFAIRSEVEALKDSTATDLQGHGAAAKEHASKLEQLLDFRSKSWELQQELQAQQQLQSIKVSDELEGLKSEMNNKLLEMKDIMSSSNAQSDLAIRNELESIKEATSQSLRGHGEATKEHASKIGELLDLKGHVKELQQRLSTHVPRNDFEAMRDHIGEQVLKTTTLIHEQRSQLQAMVDSASSDLQRHGKTTKELEMKLEGLSEFRGQSQALYEKLQVQREAQSAEVSRSLEVARETFQEQLLEMKSLMSERDQALSSAMQSECEALKEEIHRSVQNQHLVQREELQEDARNDLQKELARELAHMSAPSLGALEQQLEASNNEISRVCVEVESVRGSLTKGLRYCEEFCKKLVTDQERLRAGACSVHEKLGRIESTHAGRHVEVQEGLARCTQHLTEAREEILHLKARMIRAEAREAPRSTPRSSRSETAKESARDGGQHLRLSSTGVSQMVQNIKHDVVQINVSDTSSAIAMLQKEIDLIRNVLDMLKVGLREQGEETVELSIEVSSLRKEVDALPGLVGCRAPPQHGGSSQDLSGPRRSVSLTDLAGPGWVVAPGTGSQAVGATVGSTIRNRSPEGAQQAFTQFFSKPIYQTDANSPHGAGTARSRGESPGFQVAGTAHMIPAESPTGFPASARVAATGVEGIPKSMVASEVLVRTTSDGVFRKTQATKVGAPPPASVSSVLLNRDGAFVTRHNC